jgi:hypothetical protein
MNINDSTIISITNKAVHCEVEDEVVILGLEDGVYYGLNPVGAFIWNMIQESVSVADIKKAVLDEYEVEEEVCDNDIKELLGDLKDRGLIEIS